MAEPTASVREVDPVLSTHNEPKTPALLAWLVLAITLWLALRSLGGLLAEVQVSGAASGGMESLASGLSLDVVADTKALLETWHAATGSHRVISWTALAYTWLDVSLVVAYSILLLQCWRRVRRHQPPVLKDVPVNLTVLRRFAHWRLAWILVPFAAFADLAENGLRWVLVDRALRGHDVDNGLIIGSWTATTMKFALIGAFVAVLVVLLLDSTLLRTWLWRSLWSLWRLRVPLVATALFVVLLLADATGQAVDLARRWADDGWALAGGGLAFVGSLLLGLTVWLVARRVVLADHSGRADKPVRWWAWLLAVAVGSGLLAWWRGLTELFAISVLSSAVLVLGLLWGTRATNNVNQEKIKDKAADSRQQDAQPMDLVKIVAARRVVRILAIASPVTLLMLGAVAYAPVLPVLVVNGDGGSQLAMRAFTVLAIAIIGPPLAAVGLYVLLRAWDGTGKDKLDTRERKYLYVAGLVLGLAVFSYFGAVLHVPLVSVFLVVPVFLATMMLLLGEAQLWSERHTAPPGLLLVGFTRLPVATLLVVDLLVASFLFNDGSGHAVRRDGTLPSEIARDGKRPGLDLTGAFAAWASANCAGAGDEDRQVPLFLVAAPGGGLRGAYWTASTLSELFGSSRSTQVSGCDAAPSDRIFAMGGASGGSLGLVAYSAGLDATPARSKDWYEEQVGRPDFLTDPLTWMLSVDLARGFVGFGGADRAARLEDSWTRHMPSMGDDFFAGTWGLGGHRPVLMLTGTQVESGCRLNVSAVRLTDSAGRADGSGCTTMRVGEAQTDGPVTSELIDFLCGPTDSSTPSSLTNASAALLSGRFPYVSPSGQLYGCSTEADKATRTAIVDGGYAENTGVGMLLALWLKLERLIAVHNAVAANATIVPVFLMIDNHYSEVAAVEPRKVVEGLVPPLTQSRPDKLDDLAMLQQAAATFTGDLPGTSGKCNIDTEAGRFVSISPSTTPGLPAPQAWTLSRLSIEDLTQQRTTILAIPGATNARDWAEGGVVCQ